MPHSSGGGSSHGGSHGSSRSSKSDMRYGNRYYRGANRYVYYRNGAPEYYYSEKPLTLHEARIQKIKAIFTNIIMALVGVYFAISQIFTFPHKLEMDYEADIIINDSAQLLSTSEEREMADTFRAFQDKTGVTPAFYTIVDNKLAGPGGDIHDYSYRLYVNTFDDEKHWLVVYCVDDGKESWAWEGMIGDDCGSMITTDLENEFTKLMQKNLESEPRDLSAAVIKTFDTISGKAGKLPLKNLVFLAFFFIAGGYAVFIAVQKIISVLKTKTEDDPRLNAVECPTAEAEPQLTKCEYCNGEFVAGLHTNCPHCGAPTEKWE